jgi:hypothetical protein
MPEICSDACFRQAFHGGGVAAPTAAHSHISKLANAIAMLLGFESYRYPGSRRGADNDDDAADT